MTFPRVHQLSVLTLCIIVVITCVATCVMFFLLVGSSLLPTPSAVRDSMLADGTLLAALRNDETFRGSPANTQKLSEDLARLVMTQELTVSDGAARIVATCDNLQPVLTLTDGGGASLSIGVASSGGFALTLRDGTQMRAVDLQLLTEMVERFEADSALQAKVEQVLRTGDSTRAALIQAAELFSRIPTAKMTNVVVEVGGLYTTFENTCRAFARQVAVEGVTISNIEEVLAPVKHHIGKLKDIADSARDDELRTKNASAFRDQAGIAAEACVNASNRLAAQVALSRYK